MTPHEARLQSRHYDVLVDDYDAHYGDAWGRLYRDRFIHAALTRGLELNGKRVLEAMSGSGPSTPWLRALGAEVVGLDVSPRSVEAYRAANPGCEAVCAPITETGLPDASFDAVIVVGGLHHIHPHVDAALLELHRVLKPGGRICFAEASTGSIFNLARRLWYKLDPLFEENEAPIDVKALAAAHAGRFEAVSTRFGGTIAYLLVFNSMVFRVPARLKRLYAPALLALEAVQARLWSPELLSCFAIAQWRKRGA